MILPGQGRECLGPAPGARKGRAVDMEEKVYKVMRGAGALNITLGVVTLVLGLVSGILLIIGGAKLLAGKSKILF